MKIAFLISGFLRSFENNYDKLKSFVDKYNPDIYIYLTKDENKKDKYVNCQLDIEKIQKLCDPLYILCENDPFVDTIDTIYTNIKKMWYKRYVINKLKTCREEIYNFQYDIVIFWRPDIYVIDNFVDVFEKNLNLIDNNTILIPNTYDKAYNIGKHKIDDIHNEHNHVNDCIAIGKSNTIDTYCSMYKHIEQYESEYKNSTSMLCAHLTLNNINIRKFDLRYKLILSYCNVIGIAGDSGCGKSYISKILSELLKFDTLRLECDRYHKWERGHENWKKYTHLNPEANNLDAYSSDLLSLKLGHDIYQVDYDHCTGKFTQPDHIYSKNNVIVCGLHTLFNNESNGLINLRIFMDPQEELKLFWKIRRDVAERGYNYSTVIEKIKQRENDQVYIQGQKQNSNLIIGFMAGENLDQSKYNDKNYDPKLYLCVQIDETINVGKFVEFLIFIGYNFKIGQSLNNMTLFTFHSDEFTKENILEMIDFLKIKMNVDVSKLYNGFDGILQAIIIYLCTYSTNNIKPVLEYNPLLND